MRTVADRNGRTGGTERAVPKQAAASTLVATAERFVPPGRATLPLRFVTLLLAALLSLLAGPHEARAQYYSWGADAPQRWSHLRDDGVRLIAPDTALGLARRTLCWIRAVRPTVGEGFTRGPLEIPFVLHPDNARSNGLVMYMPKRVEFLSAPAVESYSMPWTKQLVAHEYRHAVQYGNLNRGVVGALRVLLGQQGATVGLLFMPMWALEGDAVLNETVMSTYGRGLQPSFSMGYRAVGRVGLDRRGRERRNVDRWFCGSYRDFIPDHYALGYQLCAHAYDRYGENIWDKAGRYGVRNPYTFAPTHIALRKYYGTSVRELFRETFDRLERYWAPLAAVEPTARPLVAADSADYATWRWPLELADGTVVAVRSSYARPPALVAIDGAGRERLLARVGELSTRPALRGDTLYWTEYERSALFEERVASRLWRFGIGRDRRPQRVAEVRSALYPTPSDEGLAWIEYRPEGRYALVVEHRTRCLLPVGEELHGLAWDGRTRSYYALRTSDDGMSVVRLDADGAHPVTEPAYVTLSDLRAADGSLYFGSIASGLDEAHRYDLATGREYRLTQSPYGSFAPAPAAGGLLVTTYDRCGYRPARAVRPLAFPVAHAATPTDRVNPPRRTWRAVNLDTVRFTAADSTRQAVERPAKRFRRLPRAFDLHSWAPVAFDPFRAVDEHEVDFNVGATLLSQNLLSNTEAFLSYGWTDRDGSLVDFGLRYNGLGVELGISAAFGGSRRIYRLVTYDAEREQWCFQPMPSPGNYRSVTFSATLPLLFERGARIRRLTLGAAWNRSNGRVADLGAIEWQEGTIANIGTLGYRTGVDKLTMSVGFSEQCRLAYRDFLPRWGYRLQASYALDPTNRDFADLFTLLGQLRTPGVAPHHSLQLAAAWQHSLGGYRFPSGRAPLCFKAAALLPRGFTTADISAERYAACSADYRLPLCYPEGGIPSVLYVKRIRLGAGFDFASFRAPVATGFRRRTIRSYGMEVAFDFNVLRMPDSATSSLTLSVFRPSKGGAWVSASLGLPF